MPNLGPTELIIILVIVLIIFGASRLPGLFRALGQGVKEFRRHVEGSHGRRKTQGTSRRDQDSLSSTLNG